MRSVRRSGRAERRPDQREGTVTMKLTTTTNISVDGVMQGLGGPDEDHRGDSSAADGSARPGRSSTMRPRRSSPRSSNRVAQPESWARRRWTATACRPNRATRVDLCNGSLEPLQAVHLLPPLAIFTLAEPASVADFPLMAGHRA